MYQKLDTLKGKQVILFTDSIQITQSHKTLSLEETRTSLPSTLSQSSGFLVKRGFLHVSSNNLSG